ncbi:MAG: aspartate aminotransferase family protein [Acidimicrobiales bacterium]
MPTTEPAAQLGSRRDRALGTGMPLFYREPLHLVRGDGVELFDPDGRRYVDMYNNVPCVGHANPRVTEAMRAQQSTLNTHSRYLHESIVELAERLATLHTTPGMESVSFSCSGTEAVDVAMQMARIRTGNRGFISTDGTYHGNIGDVGGLGLAARTPEAFPTIRTIPFPQRLRPIEPGLSDAELTEAYLARLDAAIESLKTAGHGVAALVLCSIQANEGLPDIPSGFMAHASAMVKTNGGLVIADEVQAGYGRPGRWWGYEVSGLQPDIVVTGKPMGNGLPLSATTSSHEIVSAWRAKAGYFNTFASSPLQAAVGLAVLDEIEERQLVENAARVGARLSAELTARLDPDHHPWLAEIRGVGLFLAIEVVESYDTLAPDSERAVEVVNRLKDAGFLTSNAGAHRNVVKIRPPLVFSDANADEFLTAFDRVLLELDG